MDISLIYPKLVNASKALVTKLIRKGGWVVNPPPAIYTCRNLKHDHSKQFSDMTCSVWLDTFNLIIKHDAAATYDDVDDYKASEQYHSKDIKEVCAEGKNNKSESEKDIVHNTNKEKEIEHGDFGVFIDNILKNAFVLESSHIINIDYNKLVKLLQFMTSHEAIVLNSIETYWFFAKAKKLWENFSKCKNDKIKELTKQHLYNNKHFPVIQIADTVWITVRCEKSYKKLHSFQFNLLNDKIKRQILLLCQYKNVLLEKFGLNKKHLMRALSNCNLPKKCPLCDIKFKFKASSHICTKYRKNEWSNLIGKLDHKLVHYSQCENALCNYLPHTVGKNYMNIIFNTFISSQVKMKVTNIFANIQNGHIFWLKVKTLPKFNAIAKEIIHRLKFANNSTIYQYCNHLFNLNKCNCFTHLIKLPNIVQLFNCTKLNLANFNDRFNFIINQVTCQNFPNENFFLLLFPPNDSVLQCKIIKRNLNKISKLPNRFKTKIIMISNSFEIKQKNVMEISFDEM